ncbi:MAG TPA: A24 family peptidase [Tepidisphaeraceae bacterium]|jgi:prepilin peptidase CpaA
MLPRVLVLVPMLALLVWAAIQDFRARRIPNWLTLSLAAGGLLASLLSPHALATPASSMGGLLAGFGIALVLFHLGALGGGDVKLLAAIGAWVGAWNVLLIWVIQAVVGLMIVLVQCAWQGKLTSLFRNSLVLAVNIAHVDTLGTKHVSETGRAFRSIDRPLPYAVPVLVAAFIVVGFRVAGMG